MSQYIVSLLLIVIISSNGINGKSLGSINPIEIIGKYLGRSEMRNEMMKELMSHESNIVDFTAANSSYKNERNNSNTNITERINTILEKLNKYQKGDMDMESIADDFWQDLEATGDAATRIGDEEIDELPKPDPPSRIGFYVLELLGSLAGLFLGALGHINILLNSGNQNNSTNSE